MSVTPLRTDGDLNTVMTRYQTQVYGLALAKTGSPADADDVFQEVFLAYYQARKTFREEEHRKAWLLRTTLNMARRVTSSTWRKKTVPLPPEEEGGTVEFQTEEENDLWRALSGLGEDYRLPLYLYYFQELSTAEIAKVMGIRPGAVRTRLTRGREQLRTALKGDYFDEP